MIAVGKRRGWRGGGVGKSAGKKDNFELFHIFKEVLGLLAWEKSLS